ERWSGRDWDRLAPQFCRPAELDMLAAAAPAARAALAAAIWCLREALFKAGAGAAAIDLLPALYGHDAPRVDNPGGVRVAAGWSLATAVHGEYCHALAWREAAAEPTDPPG
ncbi:MAG: 4-phosphopantetheinyl transferase family protein, partial [Rhodocyclaceae bacterium]|nr:4-phosphopantetheinyl transferase family protein [Rhodocyclaceae bacterium]